MKAKTTIKRDGKKIRLVAEDCTTPFNESLQIGVYAVVDKKVYSNSDIFKVIKTGEYLKICQKLKLKLNPTKIKPCSCGEKEFLQVLPKFNKYKVHCVNCGNGGQAMSTKDKAIESWNKTNRFSSR